MSLSRAHAGSARQASGGTAAPDLELVDLPGNQSFKVWSHGYPYRTVRWHYHPEYEVHLIVDTCGRFFVGDHVARFEPGNLVLTGPNLPHNWISEVNPGAEVDLRCIVVQFCEDFMVGATRQFPELASLSKMLQEASCGLEFDPATGRAAKPIMMKLLEAQGLRRMILFLELLDLLQRCPGRKRLASIGYVANPKLYASHPMNHALEFVAANLSEELREGELAEMTGLSRTAFSRAFKRHTGVNFIRYINEMRIRQACELLLSGDDFVVDICFNVGYNNLSNFNRHFLAMKKQPPSAWREAKRRDLRAAEASVAAFGRPDAASALVPAFPGHPGSRGGAMGPVPTQGGTQDSRMSG